MEYSPAVGGFDTLSMSIQNTTAESVELPENQNRESTINKNGEGEVLGATIFLSADDLEDLGVDSSEDTISYRVENGQLILG